MEGDLYPRSNVQSISQKQPKKKRNQFVTFLAFLGFLVLVFACLLSVSDNQTSTTITSPPPPTSIITDSYGIEIGTSADNVLEIRGNVMRTELMGNDNSGLIVEWTYPDIIYTMKRSKINGVECYRVAEIRLR